MPDVTAEQRTIELLSKDDPRNAVRFSYRRGLFFTTDLPFPSNTDPARRQFITPIASNGFLLRTMLDMPLGLDGTKPQQFKFTRCAPRTR